MIRLSLPWPPKELSPNARIHHFAKAKVTKLYRENAYWSLKCGRVPPWEAEGPILVSLVFHPPDKRRRDTDSMFSSCKAALDGIADALEVDDNRFEFHIRRAEMVKGGSVKVRIGEPE